MIKLLKLSFVGIGRFTKKQEIDFENREKLIQVDGKNNNTNGSSGAGKSTVFHALDYLLGINKIPASSLSSRVGKVALEVEGHFDIDGKSVIMNRSKKDGLSLTIGEEVISGNVKLAEERLEDLIGIPKELFRKMVHKKQKEGGFFLNLTAKESFDFLIKVLGLEHWTKKIEKIDTNIKHVTELNNKLKQTKDSTDSNISALEQTLNSLVEPVLTVNPKEIDVLKDKIENLIFQLNFTDDKKNKEISSISKPEILTPIVHVDDSGIQILKQNLIVLKNKKFEIQTKQKEEKDRINKSLEVSIQYLNQIENSKKEIGVIALKIKELKEQKQHVESSKCPTCTQIWVGESAVNKVESINKELLKLAEKAWDLNNISNDENKTIATINDLKIKQHQLDKDGSIRDLDEEINQLNTQIIQEQNKIDNYVKDFEINNKLKIAEYQNIISGINTKYLQEENSIRENIRNVENIIKQNEISLANYKSQLDSYKQNTQTLSSTIEKKKADKIVIDEQFVDNEKTLKVAEEAKKAIKNYTLQIFQESLDYIGEQASQIMSKIPNMANASIYFEGSKETKSGSVKDEVNAILNIDGENEINIKTLSGGEETAIQLAVDLAVIEMIEHKTGKGADFFILDEPFDGLDSICKEQCLELLQSLDTNKKIIMVDHSTELKAMVNEIITVVREGEESHVIS